MRRDMKITKIQLKQIIQEELNNLDIDSDDLIKLLGDIDGWIIRSGTKITKEHIRCSKKLRVIGDCNEKEKIY